MPTAYIRTKYYWVFFVTWVGQFSLQFERKVYSNELWNALHNYAEVYSNVLQTARVHWRVPVLFSLTNQKYTLDNQCASNNMASGEAQLNATSKTGQHWDTLKSFELFPFSHDYN